MFGKKATIWQFRMTLCETVKFAVNFTILHHPCLKKNSSSAVLFPSEFFKKVLEGRGRK